MPPGSPPCPRQHPLSAALANGVWSLIVGNKIHQEELSRMEELSKALSGSVLLNQDQTSRNWPQRWLPLSQSSCRSHSPGHWPSLSHPPPPLGHPPSSSSSSFAPWTTWQSPKLNISSGVGAAASGQCVACSRPQAAWTSSPCTQPLFPRVSPPHLRHSLVLLHLLGSTSIYSPFTQSVPGKAAHPPCPHQTPSSSFCCLCTLQFPLLPFSFLSQELHHPKIT